MSGVIAAGCLVVAIADIGRGDCWGAMIGFALAVFNLACWIWA